MPVPLEDHLRAVLTPALPSALLGVGWQGGSHDGGTVSMLWCVGLDEIERDYPALPQAGDRSGSDPPWACADLTVETDEHGRLERADFELHSLPETFRHLGDEGSAARARALYGRPARETAHELAALLEVLFATGRTGGVT